MSRVLPILFSADMVRAVLGGQKTVTRRIIKPQPKMILSFRIAGDSFNKWSYPPKTAWELWGEKFRHTEEISESDMKKIWNPPYNTDDIMYVRETWQCLNPYSDKEYVYRASCDADYAKDIGKWHPSIHMPKEAARIWLKVTDVQVERLQDITAQQAEKEGMTEKQKSVLSMDEYWYWFKELWNSTIKKAEIDKYGWSSNPWVWVIEFERCKKPE